MTINEHDRVSTGRDDESGSPQSSHALVDRLTAGEPYAVAFGGQGSAWLETLEELVSSAGIEAELATLVGEAELLLEPVARELIVVRPIGFQPIHWVRALAAEEAVPNAKHLTSAAVSVPGVLLTQIAAVRALSRQGMDLTATPPVAVAGHSQGVLAVEALAAKGAKDVELLALAQLIGTAGTLVARRRGISVLGDRPPMISVTNADPERIAELLDEFAQDVRTVLPPVLSIRNGRRSVVITGTPEQLSRFELYCEQIAEKEEAERKNKIRGGAVFRPMFDPVQVEVGFHTPRLSDAIDMVGNWAQTVGLDVNLAREMAEAILVRRVDWVSEINDLHEAGARWILDLGPGDILTRLTAPVIRGLGVGIVPGRHPRRPAQPVHGRRRARSGQALVQLCPERGHPARRLGEAVDEVHQADRPVADSARGHDPDHRRRPHRRGRRERGPLVRAGRRGTGHRGDLREPHRRAHFSPRAGPRRPVQLVVPRPVPVEASGRRQAAGAEGAPVRRPDRRRRGQCGHPRTRRGRRADRRAERRRHQPCGVQARHHRADPVRHPDRRRGADQAGHHAHRGRPRRRPPLLGGPRRPPAGHLFRIAVAVEHHRVRRRRHRHPGAGGRVPVRSLGAGLRLPADAGRRHPRGHRGDGDQGVDHLAVGQADAGRDRWHRQVDQRRKSPGRHGFQPQPARCGHPRDRQHRVAVRTAARRGGR